MSLNAKNRSAILRGLSTVIPESEAVEEMLANFATRDADEWASKEFIRAELAEVRTEMATMRAELKDDFHSETQRLITWMVGANITLLALFFTLIRLTS